VQLIVVPALVGLRLIAGLMFAAAAGAFVSTAVLWLVPTGSPEWLRPVSIFALTSAVILGVGSLGMSRLMPAPAQVMRQLPDDRNGSLPVAFVLFVTALTGVSVLHVLSVVAWWTADLSLAREFIGTSDPFGLYLVPTTLLVSTAFIATLAVLAFVISGILTLVAPPTLTSRVLGACLMLQGGLVVGLFTIERALHALGGAIQRFVDSASDPAASAGLADWLTRYELASGWFPIRLLSLLGGYALAAMWSAVILRRRESIDGGETDTFERELAALPLDAGRPIGPERPEPRPHAARTSYFQDSEYSVRPRSAWLGAWVSRHASYDIASIPATSRTQFSLSWKGDSGVIRHEPEGPDLLAVVAITGGMFGGHVFQVNDAASGSTIGTLAPIGYDWEIRDAAGQPVLHVVQIEIAVGRARFVAKAGEQELCRFVWGWTGLTAASAELQIEFLPGAETRFDKALAIVLGAVLDHQVRKASRWDSP
jgi:hypothetical protein